MPRVVWISRRIRAANVVFACSQVSLVARETRGNLRNVFKWRQAFERSELSGPGVASAVVLPAPVSG